MSLPSYFEVHICSVSGVLLVQVSYTAVAGLLTFANYSGAFWQMKSYFAVVLVIFDVQNCTTMIDKLEQRRHSSYMLPGNKHIKTKACYCFATSVRGIFAERFDIYQAEDPGQAGPDFLSGLFVWGIFP